MSEDWSRVPDKKKQNRKSSPFTFNLDVYLKAPSELKISEERTKLAFSHRFSSVLQPYSLDTLWEPAYNR